MKETYIAPSILSADFARLGEEAVLFSYEDVTGSRGAPAEDAPRPPAPPAWSMTAA